MIEGLMIGLSAAFSIQNLLMVIAGCLIGTFIGMLPGLGPMSIIAIMIPIAITMAATRWSMPPGTEPPPIAVPDGSASNAAIRSSIVFSELSLPTTMAA